MILFKSIPADTYLINISPVETYTSNYKGFSIIKKIYFYLTLYGIVSKIFFFKFDFNI